MTPCPQCGSLVTSELPDGMCPQCLMAAAQPSRSEMTQATPSPSGSSAPSIAEIAGIFPELDVLQIVGQGGMGAVYKVRQKNLDRIVALKVILHRSDDTEFAARFQREARALAKLNHPNIVTVHDFGIRGKTHYLIMEYVDGLNLRQVSSEEKLSPKMALQMVPQLCDALQYAHDQGVIHRDIKPENLLLDTNGRINIADFGLAKMTGASFDGSLTRTQQVMGTFNYMAPEQRERPTEVDHRADIYSLGVVIYEMLTGELPLGRFQPPSRLSEADERLDEVVMRALEKDPDRRYQQANQFKTGFASATEQTDSHAPSSEASTAIAPPAAAAPSRPPVAPVKSLNPPTGTRCMITFLSAREKKGNWLPGDPQLVMTLAGDAKIDLSEVQQDNVVMTLWTLMANATVIVPHGALVDLDGFIFLGVSTDNMVRSQVPCNMRVRIRSWGMMGNFEVRTPDGEPVAQTTHVPTPFIAPRDQPISPAGNGIVLLYQTVAMLMAFAIPIILLMGTYGVLPRDQSRLWGVMTALGCGFVWAGLGYFRILVGSSPGKPDEVSLQKYNSKSRTSTSIRFLGLFLGTLAAALFAYVALEHSAHDDAIQFVAIACAILGGAAFAVAGFVDQFLNSNSR